MYSTRILVVWIYIYDVHAACVNLQSPVCRDRIGSRPFFSALRRHWWRSTALERTSLITNPRPALPSSPAWVVGPPAVAHRPQYSCKFDLARYCIIYVRSCAERTVAVADDDIRFHNGMKKTDIYVPSTTWVHSFPADHAFWRAEICLSVNIIEVFKLFFFFFILFYRNMHFRANTQKKVTLHCPQ